jgi:hypothetical protein
VSRAYLSAGLVALLLPTSCSGSDDTDASRAVDPRLVPLVEALHESPGLHQLGEPASDDAFLDAERKLNRPLPNEVHALYRLSDGMALVEGNLIIEPLRSDQDLEGLSNMTDELRAHGHEIPAEAVVFASDGSDSLFALWLPTDRGRKDPAPVLELDLGGGGVALVGSDLLRFVRGRVAYYLILLEAPKAALDALSVPERLRASPETLGDAELFGLREWADPELEDPKAELFEHGTTWAAVRRRYGG